VQRLGSSGTSRGEPIGDRPGGAQDRIKRAASSATRANDFHRGNLAALRHRNRYWWRRLFSPDRPAGHSRLRYAVMGNGGPKTYLLELRAWRMQRREARRLRRIVHS
jgi:hypothetical protein